MEGMDTAGRANDEHFSIRESLAGHSVLLTGATGYLGSLVLEQLLRCVPDINTVYVLVRDRKSFPATLRVRRLLHSGLFHRVRDRPELLAKVCLVQGDLSDLKKYRDVLPLLTPTRRTSQASGSTAPTSPVSDSANGSPASNRDVELGVLHPAAKHDAASVGCWDVQGLRTRAMTVAGLVEAQHALCAPLVVIHCAARIALEDPIKVTLGENYLGTKHLLSFARVVGAAGFVHVSSAFVNATGQFIPHGTVREQHYPLKFGDTEIDPESVVSGLMSLPDRLANARCQYLCDIWGIPNSYVLGKNLTESMVVKANTHDMPISIVRPSLVGALAGEPYPGFVGNLAGPSGAALAWFLGFFDPHGTALSPYNHLDCVPGEVASSLIIAAAAANVAGCDATAGRVARAAKLRGLAAVSALAPAGPMASDARSNGGSHAAVGHGVHGGGVCVEGSGEGGAERVLSGGAPSVAIYHAATSCVNPISHKEAATLADAFSSCHQTAALKLGRNLDPEDIRDPSSLPPWRAKLAQRWLAVKVGMTVAFLSCIGQDKASRQLKYGHINFHQQVHSRKNDHRIFFDVSHVLALEHMLCASERALFPLVWRGGWLRYGYTYMAAVVQLYLGRSVPPSPEHDFRFIPNTHVPAAPAAGEL